MPDQPTSVNSERVIEILTRDPMGAALWRAAVAEATVEVLQGQLAAAREPGATDG
ncbi:MAG TPA: hypothetical protein VM429_04255 [Micropruina sp.]|nr:hypothetical protein [Micropruina sp.]